MLGPEHPDTLYTRSNLINAIDEQGKYAEAEAEYRAVIKLQEKVLGPEHPNTLETRHNLANDLANQGRYAEAEAEYRAVLTLREKVLGFEVGYVRPHLNGMLTMNRMAPRSNRWPFAGSFSSSSLSSIDDLLANRIG